MTDTDIAILNTGDLHFGKSAIDHANMYNALVELFIPKVKDSHLVNLNGDYFDTLLDLNSTYAVYALMFFRTLVAECIKYNVKLRVLRGTYLHDRDQCKIFDSLISKEYSGTSIDYRYITTIDVEVVTLNDKTMYIGYIPDSLPYKNGEKVVEVLKSKLADLDIDKLDIVFGHGTFEHTLPTGISLPPCTYNLDMFRHMTRVMVMNHIHTAGKRDYVYYSGSFDRMSHNEEGDKGFLSITFGEALGVRFHKNPHATLFKTIDLCGEDVDSAISSLTVWLDKHIPQTRAFVRIVHQDVEVRNALLKITNELRPNTICTTTTPSDPNKKSIKSLEDYHCEVVELVVPTISNLPELVFGHIVDNTAFDNTTKLSIDEVVAYLDMLDK